MESFKRFIKSFFCNRTGELIIISFTSVPLLKNLFFLLRPRHTDYIPGTLRVVKRNNIQYELDISDWVEWNIYFKNKIEPREKLYSLANKENTVIDVGVNIGETLLNLASVVGNKGRVIGFEPNPVVFIKCKKNISLNPLLKNISLQLCALGKDNSELFLNINDERNKGMVSLSHSGKRDKVKVMTLDYYLQNENLRRVDLIKIDVEGFEMNVLTGAEHTINKFHPKLFIELDNNLLLQQQSSAKELIRWLLQREYTIVNAENNNTVTLDQQFETCHFDIICHHQDIDRGK